MITEALNPIYEYIDSKSVMVLSTAGATYATRATPVFFSRQGNKFYFISVSKTIHAQNISINHKIAAAITKNYKNYCEIKGVQLFGECFELEGIKPLALAAMSYFSKFSDLKSFMNMELIKSAVDINWYELNAQKIIYTDNTIRFGYKAEFDL